MKHIKNIDEFETSDRIVMKALTLKDDPFRQWCTWVRDGDKTIETRKWQTKYRGDLLITCSKLSDSIYAGKAVCIVELYDVQRMTRDHEKKAMCKVYEGAYSWFLRNVRPIRPFDIKGKLSLFNVELSKDDIVYE